MEKSNEKRTKITIGIAKVSLSKNEEFLVAETAEDSIAFFPTNTREFQYKGETIVDNSKPTGLRYLTAIMTELKINKVDDVGEFLKTISPHALTIDHQEKRRLFAVKGVETSQ